jgi:diguanylate cyclase (GGDEF)-like protein
MPATHAADTALCGPLLALLSGYRGMAAVFDDTDHLRWANPGFRQAFGLGDDAAPTWTELMRACHARRQGAIIDCQDFEHWLSAAALRRGKTGFRQFEADLHDGRWVLMTQTTLDNGWMLELGVDVTDMGSSHRDLRVARDRALRASQEDALTGVPNRGAVLARLDAELVTPGPPPWVALVDLDHFKQVNDRHGHAAGDQVLRDFAQRLRSGLRRADACGRFGGEEFLVVLAGVQQAEAEHVLQRLLEQTRQARPLGRLPDFRYSFSAGLVQARHGERNEAVIARADAALYAAKHGGRDQVVVKGGAN